MAFISAGLALTSSPRSNGPGVARNAASARPLGRGGHLPQRYRDSFVAS